MVLVGGSGWCSTIFNPTSAQVYNRLMSHTVQLTGFSFKENLNTAPNHKECSRISSILFSKCEFGYDS